MESWSRGAEVPLRANCRSSRCAELHAKEILKAVTVTLSDSINQTIMESPAMQLQRQTPPTSARQLHQDHDQASRGAIGSLGAWEPMAAR